VSTGQLMSCWEGSELAVPEQLPQSDELIRRKSRPRVLRRLKQRQLCHRRGRRRIPDITVRGLPALVFLRCDVYYDTPVPSCSISFSASQYALLLLPYLSSPSQCVLNVPHFQLTAPRCVISSCDHCPHPSPSPSIHLLILTTTSHSTTNTFIIAHLPITTTLLSILSSSLSSHSLLSACAEHLISHLTSFHRLLKAPTSSHPRPLEHEVCTSISHFDHCS